MAKIGTYTYAYEKKVPGKFPIRSWDVGLWYNRTKMFHIKDFPGPEDIIELLGKQVKDYAYFETEDKLRTALNALVKEFLESKTDTRKVILLHFSEGSMERRASWDDNMITGHGFIIKYLFAEERSVGEHKTYKLEGEDVFKMRWEHGERVIEWSQEKEDFLKFATAKIDSLAEKIKSVFKPKGLLEQGKANIKLLE